MLYHIAEALVRWMAPIMSSRLMKSGATCRASVKICLHRRMVPRVVWPEENEEFNDAFLGTMSAISNQTKS
ncbi:hypothetical protein KCP73_08020 [Salmonella enterica subsp. enterica]|nr:hypothetical protein KCP73_08020 [Salmonella enterica subsp. enterica]